MGPEANYIFVMGEAFWGLLVILERLVVHVLLLLFPLMGLSPFLFSPLLSFFSSPLPLKVT